MKRQISLAIVSFAVLLSALPASAVPPTRLAFDFDFSFPSGLLTSVCGFPVIVRQQGAGFAMLHSDKNGQLTREFDVLPQGLTITFSSPVEEGGTGKSFTYVQSAVAAFLYPDGTDIGDRAIIVINGVQQSSGPGNPRIVGHEVDGGVIFDYTPEGVPVVDVTDVLAQSGQFGDFDALRDAWCAALSGP